MKIICNMSEELNRKEVKHEHNQNPLTMMLHDRIWNVKLAKDIIRVQSGWIYSDWDLETDTSFNSVFVPDDRL